MDFFIAWIILLSLPAAFIYIVLIHPLMQDHKIREKYKSSSIEDFPLNGHDFEHWVAEKLNASGWVAKVTQGSGDQGIDVIAEKSGFVFGIQCKRVSKAAGNSSVQQVISGGIYYGINNICVISTAGFTKSAQALASKSGVHLFTNYTFLDMSELIKPIRH